MACPDFTCAINQAQKHTNSSPNTTKKGVNCHKTICALTAAILGRKPIEKSNGGGAALASANHELDSVCEESR